jgi:hypothetical protein
VPSGPTPSASGQASAPAASSSVSPKSWLGTPILKFPSGEGGAVVGVQGDTVYVLSYPATNSSAASGQLLAIGVDGRPKQGWPTTGVAIQGGVLGAVLSADGTIYVATAPQGLSQSSASAAVIRAIGPDGHLLAGWPFTVPAAQHVMNDPYLMLNSSGSVCFLDGKPGDKAGSGLRMVIYCLSAQGKLLPGWPYVSSGQLGDAAIGTDGTLYVNEVTPGTGSNPFPHRVLAIDSSGNPKPGWVPFVSAPSDMLSQLTPGNAGVTFVALADSHDDTVLTVLGPDGSAVADRIPMAANDNAYGRMALAPQGWVYVATFGSRPDGTPGGVTNLAAINSSGKQMPGFPITIENMGRVLSSPQGEAWLFNIDQGDPSQPQSWLLQIVGPNGVAEGVTLPDVQSIGRAVFDADGVGYAAVVLSSGYAIERVSPQA